MYLDTPPRIIKTEVFTSMPATFRRTGTRSEWADANKGGACIDCFLEGPTFDAAGNLYVVDIPFGRIFRISPDAKWELVIEYDGWPNGLKMRADGHLIIADYRSGLLALDPKSRVLKPILSRRNSESFKGCNDLFIAPDGDIFFTDQGQTGLHDPTGRVYRLCSDGRLDVLISNGISPNGLVLDGAKRVLFVAMTRDNSVWRVPLARDGGVHKAGRFCSMFGVSGPDGLAIDRQGRLYVAHASLGCVFIFAPNGECVARVKSCAGNTCTSLTLSEAQDCIYITESSTGVILRATLAW